MTWLNETEKNLKQNLKIIITCSAFWGIGYIGMWIEKWIIASIVLNKNIFTDGLSQFLIRSSNEIDGTSFTKWECIERQILVLQKWPYLLLFIGTLVVILIKSRKNISNYSKTKNKIPIIFSKTAPYMLLCIYPFIWFFIATNHCYINPKFTYRMLGITVFAGFSGLIKLLQVKFSIIPPNP